MLNSQSKQLNIHQEWNLCTNNKFSTNFIYPN